MRSTLSLASAILALTTLTSALPQQSEKSTALAINPINGLPLPVAQTSSTDTQKPTSDASTDDEASDTDSDSPTATITAAATLASTGSSSPKSTSGAESDSDSDSDSDTSSPPSSSDSESSSSLLSSTQDPSLIIWTDTAENTIYTMTRVTTSASDTANGSAHPTVLVEITNAAGQEEIVPTRSVDTFVQAYTGAAAPLLTVGGGDMKGRERVWWLLALVGAVGLL